MNVRIRQSLLLALGLTCSVAHAADLYVICHADASIAAGEVKDVFMGEKQFVGSVKLQPADNSAAQAAFLEKVLKMDAGKYSTSWTKKSFRDGANPPPVKGSDAEAVEFVKRTAGACSYVSSAPPAGVLTIASY
jgi:hypothetical protein